MQVLMCLTFLVIGLTIAGAQMTFSDGFMKRAKANENRVGIESPMLDECHTSYSQALIDLHHKIMLVYESYQTCQNLALASFRQKIQQGS